MPSWFPWASIPEMSRWKGAMQPRFNPYTFAALPLVVLFNGIEISKATGFVVHHAGQHYLVSNRHVFSGRHALSQKRLDEHNRDPDEVLVTHPSVHGGFVKQTYALTSHQTGTTGAQSLWLEHPVFTWIADVAALPITLPAMATHTALFEADLDLPEAAPRPVAYRVGLTPALDLNIIGFPFGRRGGYETFGIWTRAYVASEPLVDIEGAPAFLVDSRTRNGNSGSPVVFYRDLEGFRDAEGEVHSPPEPYGEFVGIYSHRLNDHSDIGVVVTAAAVRSVLTQEHS